MQIIMQNAFISIRVDAKRIHFFKTTIDTDIFLKFVLKELTDQEFENIRNSYLGFVVSRPLPDAIIGRTAIGTYEPDGGRRHYPCTRDYKANLFGIDLTVKSLAFQEQDSVLAACATVSLWCAFHKTAELFGSSIPTPAAITQVANRVVRPARSIPSGGLDIQQICNSIRHMGLEPEVVQIRSNVPVVSLVYAHLCMEIPVLLVAFVEDIGFHAITLNGYSLRNNRVNSSEVAIGDSSIPMVGLRIDEFYGHDDQIGPFARLKVGLSATHGSVTYPIVFGGSWKDKNTGLYLNIYPTAVIFPVYHKIRVTFLNVQTILTRLNSVFGLLGTFLGFPLDLEWDISLKTSNWSFANSRSTL